MRVWIGFLVLVAAIAGAAPAFAALFTLRCTIEGEPHSLDFLFDTRSSEVLQRRVGADAAQLAKYKTLEMTYNEVIFGKFALIGEPRQKYKVSRSGGPIYESLNKGGWSDWTQVGTCSKR